jgi:hypothetical protein
VMGYEACPRLGGNDDPGGQFRVTVRVPGAGARGGVGACQGIRQSRLGTLLLGGEVLDRWLDRRGGTSDLSPNRQGQRFGIEPLPSHRIAVLILSAMCDPPSVGAVPAVALGSSWDGRAGRGRRPGPAAASRRYLHPPDRPVQLGTVPYRLPGTPGPPPHRRPRSWTTTG